MIDTAAAAPHRPVPLADALTRPFWEAANEQRLVFQRCQACRHFQHPPRMVCDACGGDALRFEDVGGTGTIHSMTVVHVARNPAFEAMLPYAIVWVELDAQPGLVLIANMPGVPVSNVRIGDRVEAWFEALDEVQRVPQFRPCSLTEQLVSSAVDSVPKR